MKIKKFNDALENEITLSIDDISKLTHNLGKKFLKDYNWTEDTTLIAKKSHYKPKIWNGETVNIYDLLTVEEKYKSYFGYLIILNDVPKYIISIYEPHGCDLNPKRGLIIAHGHEQIIQLWLDDGEFNEIHTR